MQESHISDFGRNENHHLKGNTLGRRYCYVISIYFAGGYSSCVHFSKEPQERATRKSFLHFSSLHFTKGEYHHQYSPPSPNIILIIIKIFQKCGHPSPNSFPKLPPSLYSASPRVFCVDTHDALTPFLISRLAKDT